MSSATAALFSRAAGAATAGPFIPFDFDGVLYMDMDDHTDGVSWGDLWDDIEGDEKEDITRVIRRAVEHYDHALKRRVKEITDSMHDKYRLHFDELKESVHILNQTVEVLLNSNIEAKRQIADMKRQLDAIPADSTTNQTGGPRLPKMPDPPTFSGSDSKQPLEDWLNQVALFCSSMGIVTDKQRIITALGRLRTPASRYMKRFFDNIAEDKDIGSWPDFVKELKDIYGQKDSKESAKEELDKLCGDKNSAKDFIKFCERYKTLARMTDYDDTTLVDKIKKVETMELRQATISLRVTNNLPTKWEEYIDMLLQVYKALHPDKAKEAIFKAESTGKSNDAKETSGGGKAKEANSATTSTPKFCQICSGKGKKGRAKTHNTNDCYDKPGNESRRPQQQQSQSPASGSKPPGNGNTAGTGATKNSKFKAFKSRLAELQQEARFRRQL